MYVYDIIELLENDAQEFDFSNEFVFEVLFIVLLSVLIIVPRNFLKPDSGIKLFDVLTASSDERSASTFDPTDSVYYE